ncbi:MAG: cytochrome P460 family protein [Vicinamibacterales bacterium]
MPRHISVINRLAMVVGAIWLVGLVMAVQPAAQSAETIRYTDTGELIKPPDFREWIFVSAGLGMNYNPQGAGAANPSRPPAFTNVFVNPSSYRAFLRTGAWPDKTMFVLEIRGSSSEGSINKAGRFQSDVMAIEAEVKDSTRPDMWAYYDFGATADRARPLPKSAACYECHSTKAAVEQTFVQFYPTLMDIARRQKTVNPTYSDAPAARP